MAFDRARLQRGFLAEIEEDKPDTFAFQFNPTQLKIEQSVKWNRYESPGLSHQRVSFVQTENTVFPVTLFFDQAEYDLRLSFRGDVNAPGTTLTLGTTVGGWMRFLSSHTCPRNANSMISKSSPGPLLFVWPNVVSARVRLEKVGFTVTEFAEGTAKIRVMTAECQFFEDVPRRFTPGEVRDSGFLRPWA